MRKASILFLLLVLSACADGRWVVRDLSSFSFQFAAPGPEGPFAKPTRAVLPPAPDLAWRRAAPQAAATVAP